MPAIWLASGAALSFAVANNLQRHAASRVPIEAGGPVRLVLRLLRTRRWLLGSSLAVAALALHAVALARGGVILVQAVLAAGLIVALGLEALRERRWMDRREMSGSLLLVAGVTTLLGWGRPGDGIPVDITVQSVTGVMVLAVSGIGLVASRAHHQIRLSAMTMGIAAGTCFALDAVFLKGLALATNDLDALPALINVLGFATASGLGNLIVQRAYQRAPLRLVLPAVTAADPLCAFAVGRLLLHEHLSREAGSGTAVAVGLVAVVVGITLTTASAHLRAPSP
jgi:hypothetical protein